MKCLFCTEEQETLYLRTGGGICKDCIRDAVREVAIEEREKREAEAAEEEEEGA